MDFEAVRTFVAVVDAQRFQDAAADLAIRQQAVSKRIAALEKSLGVQLFTRTPRGARLTLDGHAFLPHARTVLQAAERALASVRPGSRALRVDVVGRKLAPAGLLRAFHGAHPHIELDVVTLEHAGAAMEALSAGTVDAAIRCVPTPAHPLPEGLRARPIFDEPLELLVGPDHKLAKARTVTPEDLVGHRIWMPGIVTGTEWAAYYESLAAAFDLTIDPVGPNFGLEPLLDAVADSPTVATLVGEDTRFLWPATHQLRRIPLRDPTPAYPHSLLHRADDPHPTLAALHDHFAAGVGTRAGLWVPDWARITE
ncbi:LysR family transcriptional regulator [Nocardia sp. CDC160]|uniref:LysR family transcriptional regulator n=1 Tax=Nocardia sp. CDC160 TaxID=3112166 RepID=UPI002DBD1F01|nr:LysR family transcriptional regulator [Nocardia sp. CDC160]MEC3914621.1 LysR family transcriptional regulator [Nocardia sp. CDC160]